MILVLLAGCLTLDAMVHGGIPCTAVGPSTCEDSEEDEWGKVCVPCDEPYDWAEAHPWTEDMVPGGSLPPIDGAEQEALATGEGDLDLWWLPASVSPNGVTVLYSHGNYAGIEHYRPRARMLAALGFDVLIWDYRGYGKTTPHTFPSAEDWEADAARVREAVVERAADPDRVLIYGYSLGAIPSVNMAISAPGCALALEAPFTSISAIAEASAGLGLPGSHLTSGAYENIDKIGAYAGPLLTMVGDEDELFSPDAVGALADAAGGSVEQWVVKGARHGVSRGVPEVDFAGYSARLAALAAGPCAAP